MSIYIVAACTASQFLVTVANIIMFYGTNQNFFTREAGQKGIPPLKSLIEFESENEYISPRKTPSPSHKFWSVPNEYLIYTIMEHLPHSILFVHRTVKILKPHDVWYGWYIYMYNTATLRIPTGQPQLM